MNSYTRSFSARRRGSVLIVALIFAAVIAISLGSFLQLSTTATKLSFRTHYQGVAMNIAETGLEQAMWELNSTGSSWTGWTPADASGAYRRSFDLGTVEGNATAVVKVYAQKKIGAGPAWIVARSIVTPAQGKPLEKWVKVTLQRRTRGSIGGLGREGITASGNQVVMGSWDSDPDNNPATPPVPYSAAVANDEMSLATIAIDATLSSGNADVNGKAAVGSDTTAAIQVGAQGYIGPFGTAAGTKDPNSISANFSADMPLPELPTGVTYTDIGTITTATVLPDPGHTPNADGVYYYTATEIILSGATLEISPGKEVVILIDKNSGNAVSISGNGGAIKVAATLVTNTVTGAQTYSSGKLKIYTGGDIVVSGQGTIINEIATQTYTPLPSTNTTSISNVQPIYGKGQQKNTVIGYSYTQTIVTTPDDETVEPTTTTGRYEIIAPPDLPPESIETIKPVVGTTTGPSSVTTDTGSYVGAADNLRIYGTRTDEAVEDYGDQTIKLSGNGSLSAVVDAPNADIEAKGGGNSGFVYGSLAGKSLKFTGNDCFYYDESLGDSDEGARLGIEDWDEMVSYADRNTYSSYLNF